MSATEIDRARVAPAAGRWRVAEHGEQADHDQRADSDGNAQTRSCGHGYVGADGDAEDREDHGQDETGTLDFYLLAEVAVLVLLTASARAWSIARDILHRREE